MKNVVRMMDRAFLWLKKQWRLGWLVLLMGSATAALTWGLPLLVSMTVGQSFDRVNPDYQYIDPLPLLPEGTAAHPTASPSPTPAPTPKLPCKYPPNLTEEELKAVEAAKMAFTSLLGSVVELSGYECFVSQGMRPARETATATPPGESPSPKPSPTKNAKPTPKPSGTAESASPAPTAEGQREMYWQIEWRPVDISSRFGNLLVGDQFMTFTADIRQKDLAVLSLDTVIYGEQVKLLTMDTQKRMNAAYNLVRLLGFDAVDAKFRTKNIKTDENGEEVVLSTTLQVEVKKSADSEETMYIRVNVNEFNGKPLGFSLDDSWY